MPTSPSQAPDRSQTKIGSAKELRVPKSTWLVDGVETRPFWLVMPVASQHRKTPLRPTSLGAGDAILGAPLGDVAVNVVQAKRVGPATWRGDGLSAPVDQAEDLVSLQAVC